MLTLMNAARLGPKHTIGDIALLAVELMLAVCLLVKVGWLYEILPFVT